MSGSVLPAGTIAWASAAPPFHPPGPHPIVILRAFANGNVLVGFVTHSADLLRVGVPLTRSDVPSAFRERGGPLTDDRSVLALIDHRGRSLVAVGEALASDRIAIGHGLLHLSRVVQLPDAEWQAVRWRLRQALGLA